jgi:addiction module HigA family antidote
MSAKLRPVHPGEILREEFITPLGLNPHKLAMALHVAAPRIYEIVNEERDITPDTALRLARLLGTTPEFWLNLQSHYDLEIAREKELAKIEREVRPMNAADA